jgi:hypothetical protein
MEALGLQSEAARKLRREKELLLWAGSSDMGSALSRVPAVAIKRILSYLRKESYETVVTVSDAFMYASIAGQKAPGRPFSGGAIPDVTELSKAMRWLGLHLKPLGMVDRAALLVQRFFCIEAPVWALARRGRSRPVMEFLDWRSARASREAQDT